MAAKPNTAPQKSSKTAPKMPPVAASKAAKAAGKAAPQAGAPTKQLQKPGKQLKAPNPGMPAPASKGSLKAATGAPVTPTIQREESGTPMTPKNFRNHPDMENFFRFIYENDLRIEALHIIDEIIVQRAANKRAKKGAAAAASANA